MRILAAVVLIICLVSIVVISYTVPRTRLTPAERAQALGAAEGAPFIARHIIEAAEVAFDDFAGGKADVQTNRRILGLA